MLKATIQETLAQEEAHRLLDMAQEYDEESDFVAEPQAAAEEEQPHTRCAPPTAELFGAEASQTSPRQLASGGAAHPHPRCAPPTTELFGAEASRTSPWQVASGGAAPPDRDAALDLLRSGASYLAAKEETAYLAVEEETVHSVSHCSTRASGLTLAANPLRSATTVRRMRVHPNLAEQTTEQMQRDFAGVRDQLREHTLPPDAGPIARPTTRQQYFSAGRRLPARGDTAASCAKPASARRAAPGAAPRTASAVPNRGGGPHWRSTPLVASQTRSRYGDGAQVAQPRSPYGPMDSSTPLAASQTRSRDGDGSQSPYVPLASSSARPPEGDRSQEALAARHVALARHAALLSTSGFVPTPSAYVRLPPAPDEQEARGWDSDDDERGWGPSTPGKGAGAPFSGGSFPATGAGANFGGGSFPATGAGANFGGGSFPATPPSAGASSCSPPSRVGTSPLTQQEHAWLRSELEAQARREAWESEQRDPGSAGSARAASPAKRYIFYFFLYISHVIQHHNSRAQSEKQCRRRGARHLELLVAGPGTRTLYAYRSVTDRLGRSLKLRSVYVPHIVFRHRPCAIYRYASLLSYTAPPAFCYLQVRQRINHPKWRILLPPLYATAPLLLYETAPPPPILCYS